MTIRNAVSTDVLALDALEQRLFEAANYPISRRMFRYHIRHNLLLVAQSNSGGIMGYVLVLIRRKKAKLYSLGVDVAFRGRGVARMLLEKMLEHVRDLGFTCTVLEVRCDNAGAIRLYRETGFETIRILKGFYRDGCDAYFMEKCHAGAPLPQTL